MSLPREIESIDLPNPLLLALLLSGILLIFWGVYDYGFVQDDRPHILENTLLQVESAWKDIWQHGMYPGNLYRPITLLSFLVNPFSASAFHIVNVFLYTLCVLLVFAFLRPHFGKSVAVLTAVLFAAHPLHYEVVANVSARSELLSFLFGMGGLCVLFSTRDFGKIREILCFCLFLSSALSKESGILFPLLGSLGVYCFGLRKEQLRTVILAGISAVVVALSLRYFALGSFGSGAANIPFVDNPLASLVWYERIPYAIALLGKYLFEICFPFSLRGEYRFAELSEFYHVFTTQTLAFLLLAVIGAVSSLYSFFTIGKYAFPLLWFFVAFAITSNIFFPIGTLYAERLAFLPSMGILLFLAMFIARFRLSLLLVVAIALIWTLSNRPHLLRWKSEKRFFAHAIEVSPKSVPALTNAAAFYRNRGEYEKAMQLSEEALRLLSFPEAMLVKASIFAVQGQLDEAKKTLQQSLLEHEGFSKANVMLGRIYLQEENYPAAKAQFENASKQLTTAFDGLLGLYALAILKMQKAEVLRLEKILNTLNSHHPDFQRLRAQARARDLNT